MAGNVLGDGEWRALVPKLHSYIWSYCLLVYVTGFPHNLEIGDNLEKRITLSGNTGNFFKIYKIM